jgi:hypothetical protein
MRNEICIDDLMCRGPLVWQRFEIGKFDKAIEQ